MSKKAYKTLAVIFGVAAILWVAGLIGDSKTTQMDAYAQANNCTWHYDYYVTEAPVCK